MHTRAAQVGTLRTRLSIITENLAASAAQAHRCTVYSQGFIRVISTTVASTTASP
jgi:hypothetical protein